VTFLSGKKPTSRHSWQVLGERKNCLVKDQKQTNNPKPAKSLRKSIPWS